MSSYVGGIVAAVTAPFVMVVGFLFWEEQWKGSAFSLNLFKCCTASVGFLILSLTVPFQRETSDTNLTTHRDDGVFPAQVFTFEAVGFLFLSSTIGIVIGDWTWLRALQLLGAKRVILMDSLKPFLAAFFGWLLLDENLQPIAVVGIALTVFGIIVVSFGDSEDSTADDASSSCEPEEINDENGVASAVTANDSFPPDRRMSKRTIGYLMSIINVVLDTYGSVLTKEYGVRMTVWEINLLRFGFAGAVMFTVSLICSFYEHIKKPAVEERISASDSSRKCPWYTLPMNHMTQSKWLYVSIGVVLVTFLTPALSNYALFQVALGLALTLGSIGPLYQIPLAYFINNRMPTRFSVLGALLAVAGVAVLAFFGTLPGDDIV